MRNVRKILIVVLIAFLFAGGTAYAKDPAVKFGRGVTNFILSPAEIIYQPIKLSKTENALVAWFGGIPKGILYFPYRAGVGLYDAATFFIPYPEHYEPLLEPETLVEGFKDLNTI
ncbi:MAG: hypothetical protein A3C35_06750 [Omnitrophica bacterium RIFCSPHIGHO2_02_FULL_46_11]|nr:MAG: hypothetical protein A3C35_06750 [Omnitrophica bacterium RIFCSPHIGHO2_02_FULL_46_11]OGW86731.1 MAG: hypothetical protein A3A81_08650 [Omnitrophica bacterium RIFCSPLOWO2_01_FULL_45_10b]